MEMTKLFVLLFSCPLAFASAESDDSKGCKAIDKLYFSLGAQDVGNAVKVFADGAEFSYGKGSATNTPGLTDFGTQKLSHAQTAKFLMKTGEAFDIYGVCFSDLSPLLPPPPSPEKNMFWANGFCPAIIIIIIIICGDEAGGGGGWGFEKYDS